MKKVDTLDGMTQSQKAAYRSIYIFDAYEVVDEYLEKNENGVFYVTINFYDLAGDYKVRVFKIGKRGKITVLA